MALSIGGWEFGGFCWGLGGFVNWFGGSVNFHGVRRLCWGVGGFVFKLEVCRLCFHEAWCSIRRLAEARGRPIARSYCLAGSQPSESQQRKLLVILGD